MTFEAILKEIKGKIYHPVYVLHGEESYFIDVITNALENSVLTETEKAFNQTILYGKDSSIMQVIETARRLPMMSNYQVVILKEAQYLKQFEDLEKYISNPVKSTVLVIAHKHKRIDKRKKIYKEVVKKAVVMESPLLRDYQIPTWIKHNLSEHGYSISEKGTMLLTEYLGTDLSKISNELQKLMLNKEKGSEINVEDIEKNVGISKDYNVFEMQEAIGRRDVYKTFKIVKYMSANPRNNPFVLTLGALNQYFVKLFIYHHSKNLSDNELAAQVRTNPRFLFQIKEAGKNFGVGKIEQIFDLLQEYDLKSKGVLNTKVKEDELLKEMVFKILN